MSIPFELKKEQKKQNKLKKEEKENNQFQCIGW